MSLCKHGFVGSPLPLGKSVGKANVARKPVVYSFNGSLSTEGQSTFEQSRLFFIASLSRWSLVDNGKKYCFLSHNQHHHQLKLYLYHGYQFLQGLLMFQLLRH